MRDGITYPAEWSTESRDALDGMFVEARATGMWFFHNSMAAGPLWFSPDELEAEQKKGRFLWGALNWKLRVPSEHLAEVDAAIAAKQAERVKLIARMQAV